MPLRQPSPEIPVITFLSPNKADQGLVEIWNTENADYVPLDLGASHPNSRQYPNFRLGKQAPVQGDERWYIRTWVTDETSPEWFNWAQKYSGEDNAYPIFIRTYREPKATYQPRAKQSSLGAFYKLVLDNPGSGFTNGTLPAVTFDTESATPALAHGVVSPDGTLAECVLDFCGDGYTGNVAFTVDAPANGNPASGTAYIQPATAILVKEEANLYPEDSEFYAQYFQVVRVYETLPGPTLDSTKIAEDGMVVNVATTRGLCADIDSGEVINGGFWIKTTKEQTDIDFVCNQVQETRPIPGNPMTDIKIEKDGKTLDVVKTLKDISTITPSEAISGGGVWVKTEQQNYEGSNIVALEVVTARDALGNTVPSASIDGDHEIRNTGTRLRDQSAITPSATESGGFITTVEQGDVGDLVSEQITTVTRWLDKAEYAVSIINLIPREFMAFVPTFTESHIIAGTASMPSLAGGEFEHSKRQLTKLLYEERIVSLGSVSLPITHTNQEITEEYGGGVLNVTYVLETQGSGTIDQGLLVTESSLTDLGNGMEVKLTKELDGDAWPSLIGTEVDPRTGIVIGITKQVVAAGATGGVITGVYTDVKSIDKWRSIRIASKLDPATLPDPVSWETTAEHAFPNTLVAVAWVWDSATDGACCGAFDMALESEIDQGYAGPCRALVTESFTNGPPSDTVSVTQFFPKANEIGYSWGFGNADCGTCGAHAKTWALPPTLHDAITIAGSVIIVGGHFTSTLPATTPIGLPSPGTLITKSVDVERWRFGVFFRRVTEIYVPG